MKTLGKRSPRVLQSHQGELIGPLQEAQKVELHSVPTCGGTGVPSWPCQEQLRRESRWGCRGACAWGPPGDPEFPKD